MNEFIESSDVVVFEKTVGESDVYTFAGLTGDLARNHVSDAFMKKSQYGQRIAHGALMVGFMSTASTMMVDKATSRGYPGYAVSVGYDRIRFIEPVFFGDTLTVSYRIAQVEQARRRTIGLCEVKNQRGATVSVGHHVMKWLDF